MTIGLTSFNIKHQVPSDIPTHGQYIPSENLRSQDYLTDISQWTNKQKMLLNTKKSKTMIFNYTTNFQFTTRLSLEGTNLDVVKYTTLLGTIITDDLKFDRNTDALIKKAYIRMQLLRRLLVSTHQWKIQN